MMLTKIDTKDLHRLAQIVREETGNQVQEKNFSMLESRIRNHTLKLGVNSMEEYWTYFSENEEQERSSLQSLMTTHYTFFFREYAHFEVLDQWISSTFPYLKQRFETSKQPVRVWSAACSRGQEVYSLAMFLELNLFKKYGIPFEVMGTDIDPDSVAYAKNGVYPIKEVNTIPQMYLKGFWKKGSGSIKDYAAIHPTFKSKTNFDVLNLLEIQNWANNQIFDVIFCRNVFIYFSEANVQKIALDLLKKMDPKGLFVSGMSEPLRFSEWKLESIGPSCYQRPQLELEKAVSKASTPLPILQPTQVQKQVENAKYNVLCVDDSKTIQVLIKSIFAKDPNCSGVDFALNGREAREKLDAKKFDLITLDIHMPEVNGIEFLQNLYRIKEDPPVLMVSSVNRTDLELATKSLSLGAFDYVEKPAMNNLQKSTDEILTKGKMALRSRGAINQIEIGGFDTSISQKIVVPDASQCLRVISCGPEGTPLLRQILEGQKNEYRSPALVIVWKGPPTDNVENEILQWTSQTVNSVRSSENLFKPNHTYVVRSDFAGLVLKSLKAKNISLQVLDKSFDDLNALKNHSGIQVLIDESLAGFKDSFQRSTGIPVSDVTPATSFPSLSVEYFANLRKAAA